MLRKSVGVKFFVNVIYERILQFCSFCLTIGHNAAMCRRKPDNQRNQIGRVQQTQVAPVERQDQRLHATQSNEESVKRYKQEERCYET